MSLNPFSAADYPEMLWKIALWTFFSSLACTMGLQYVYPSLTLFLGQLPSVTVYDMELSLGTLLVPLLFAAFTRSIKLHDRLSDLFRIRIRFDVDNILLPLAVGCGVTMSPSRIGRLEQDRHTVMRKVFYCYASGTVGQSKIDRQYILMALDQWYWYWIVLESSVVLGTTALILAIGSHFLSALILLAVIEAGHLVRCVLYHRAVACALVEVEEILNSVDRKEEIAKVLNAL